MLVDVLETAVLTTQYSCSEKANEETDTSRIEILFGILRLPNVFEKLIVCQTL